MKRLLSEDDCAPDAYEYFCEKFEEIVGVTVDKFKSSAFDISGLNFHRWVTNDYQLEYYADDPFYVLYRL